MYLYAMEYSCGGLCYNDLENMSIVEIIEFVDAISKINTQKNLEMK